MRKLCVSGILLFTLFLQLLSGAVSAQSQTLTYTAPGTYTFVPPCGVTSVTVECWGGGGGGGYGRVYFAGGGGGGGGAYAKSIVAVTPGTSYTIEVGAGGTGGAANGSTGASKGGNTSFAATTVLAQGGGEGGGAVSAGSGQGLRGYGGPAATSIGTTVFSGGAGGKGNDSEAGGGGGSAGPLSNGNSVSVLTGFGNIGAAAVTGGGSGANGGTNTAGQNGGLPGGGGSGGHTWGVTNNQPDQPGGKGGDGKVVITYTGLCTATFSNTTEPVTKVSFAGINNTTAATIDGTPDNEFFCSTMATLTRGASSNSVSLKGNTNGNFTDYFTVFIDWDENGVYGNNSNEIYNIGTITNSSGTDGASAIGNIAVPATALLGNTYMRVVKNRGSYTTSACATNSYGQAEDYTVLVKYPPTITSFTPSSACANTGTVVITGTDFSGVTGVKIGGTAAAAFTVNSTTQITATVAAGTTGTISVTTPGGTAISAATFTVNPAPAAIGGGTTIVCAGNTTAPFTDATVPGTWSIINGTGSASIDAAGIVTGITAGTVTVVYTAGGCPVSTSLTVTDVPTVTSNPANASAAIGGNATFTAAGNNNTTSYIWEVNAGSGWTTVSNGGTYSNAGTGTLTITGATFSMNGYQYRATAVNGCGNSTVSATAVLTVSYCTPGGGNDVGINGVIFNTIDNSDTGIDGYTDYSGTYTTTVTMGGSYDLTVYASAYWGGYLNYQKAWIDWNRNGIFETSEAYDLGSTSEPYYGLSSACPLSIMVPFTATPGFTKMRIQSQYNASPNDPCNGIYESETEDYGIIIATAPACTTPSAQPTALNLVPSYTGITGSFTPAASASGYLVMMTTSSAPPSAPQNGTVYTAGASALGGTVVYQGTSSSFSTTNLNSGTTYWYWIFSYNSVCTGQPYYLTTNPLSGNTTTLTCAGTATNTMTVSSAGSGTLNWNTASNWSLGHVPLICEDAVINATSNINGEVDVQVPTNAAVNSLTINLSAGGTEDQLDFSVYQKLTITNNFTINHTQTGGSNHGILVTNTGTISCKDFNINQDGVFSYNNATVLLYNFGKMYVNGNTLVNAHTSSAANGGMIDIAVGDWPGEIIFKGDAVFDDGSSNAPCKINIGATATFGAANSGRMTFMGNVTFGPKVYNTNGMAAGNGYVHGSTVFDAPSAQTVTINTPDMYFPTVMIGNLNSPTVTFAGTSNSQIGSGALGPLALNINNHSVLDLQGHLLNMSSPVSSSLNMASGSTLKLGGTSGGQTGSNFPKNFSEYNLSPGSTIDYTAAGQSITNSIDYQNLTMSGTSGNITAPAGTLTVKGDLKKTGAVTFVHSNGLLKLNGTEPQGIYTSAPTPDLYDLTITNPTGVTVYNDVNVYRHLLVNSGGKLSLDAGNLSLKSTATNTADLGEVAGTIDYPGAGRFIIEKYIKTPRKWQFLSTDATAGTQSFKDSWMEGQTPGTAASTGYGMWITGPDVVPNFDANTAAPSVKWWNGVDYTGIGSVYSDIHAHNAYMVYVRGDRGSTGTNGISSTTVLRAKGMVHTGNYPAAAVNLPAFNAEISMANPYASAVDLRAINTGAPGNTLLTIYLWDPKLAGSSGLGGYQTLTGSQSAGFTISPGGGSYGLAQNDPMNTLESGQAFFIQGATTDLNLQFTESAKDDFAHTVSFTGSNPQFLGGQLFIRNGTDNPLTDGFGVKFDNSYNNSADASDASKRQNSNENVSVKKDGRLLAVELRKPVSSTDTIFVNMNNMRPMNYRWTVNTQNMDAPGRTAFLMDKYTGTETVLNLAGSTDYDFSVTAAGESFAADRFMVVFKPAVAVTVKLNDINAIRKDAVSAAVKWTAENETNVHHYELEKSADGSNFNFLSNQTAQNNNSSADYSYTDSKAGRSVVYYRVRVISNNGAVQYSPVVKVSGTEDAGITVSPNPVSDHIIHLQMNMQPAGRYSLQLANAEGKIILTKTVTVSNTFEQLNIPADNNIAEGLYLLNITSPTGDHSVQKIIFR